MGEGTYENVQALVNILEKYQKATRMAIDIKNSKLAFNNLSEEPLNKVRESVPYPTTAITKGIKYLGFSLNPNAYAFQDYLRLFKKVEARISMWENHFLSRGGRLVLIKEVLHSILIYWDSIAYIPKGIMEKIMKKCLSFLWTVSKQTEGIPLVKLTTLVLPKSRGCWGIKNLELLCRSLDSKYLWRIEKNPEFKQ